MSLSDDTVSVDDLVTPALEESAEEAPTPHTAHPLYNDVPPKRAEIPASTERVKARRETPTPVSLTSGAPAKQGQPWWRRLLGTGRHESHGSAAETTATDIATMQSALERPLTVVVAQNRGEAGKTVTTIGLGSALSAARGGGVVAWDNNEAPGNLADRVERRTAASMRDLLESAGYFAHPNSNLVELERTLQHQSTSGLQILASDPLTVRDSIDANEFTTILRVLLKYFRMVLVDTGNSARAENWRAAVSVADVLVVPLKMRSDHLVPAGRMLRDLEESDPELADRVVLAVSCGPDDRHVTAEDRESIFTEFNLARYPLVEIPTDHAINTARTLRWGDLGKATQAAYQRLGAQVLEAARRI